MKFEVTVDRFFTLASGSSGNCGVFSHSGATLLIDCGISAKRIVNSLFEAGIDPASLSGILLTHEHSDHISGLSMFCKHYNIPVYTSQPTAQAIKLKNANIIYPDTPFAIGEIKITPIKTHHDTLQSLAFVFDTGNTKYGYLTDCGNICDDISNALIEVEHLILEANYDYNMLINGKYPHFLKKRILGPNGHLSNKDSGELVSYLVNKSLKNVMLSHLSKENNTSDTALVEVSSILDSKCMKGQVSLKVADRNNTTLFVG